MQLTQENLARYPVKDGFRQRGMDMTRLETFTDAAFAFAVTLLVVGGSDAIPLNFGEMIAAMKQVPAFAASFANIMIFWYAHHKWSRRFGLDDAGTVFFSLLLIFVVLIYVYPLKAIYSGAIEFFSGGYFPSYFRLEIENDLRNMFTIFSAGYLSLSLVVVMLNRHALKKRDELLLTDLEEFDTRTEQHHWSIQAGVALLSVMIALFAPTKVVVLAGICYGLLGVLVPLFMSRREKLRDNLAKT